MVHTVKVNILGASIALALGMGLSVLASVALASRAFNDHAMVTMQANRSLTVKGTATKRVTSDIGVWRIDVTGSGATLEPAYTVLEASTERIQAFLDGMGFLPADRTLSAIGTSYTHERDAQGRPTNTICTYHLRRSFTITSNEVDRIHAAASEVTRLLKDGVRVESQPPSFTFTQVADEKVDLIALATEDARRRATAIAEQSGSSIQGLRTASQGVIQIVTPNSTETSSYGRYDTSTIEKDIRMVVTVTFVLGD